VRPGSAGAGCDGVTFAGAVLTCYGLDALPLVVPVLFYAGKRSPYPYSTCWLQEFDNPALAEKLYNNAFPLVDVTVIPDDEIMEHRSMAALTLLQKHIYQRDLIELIDKLGRVLRADYNTGQQVISLVNYIIQVGESADADAFLRELAQRVPQHGDKLMTIAQQLEQKGIEKGMEKGRINEALKIARNLLQRGISHDVILEVTGLSERELKQLHS